MRYQPFAFYNVAAKHRNPESDGGNMNVMDIIDIKVSSLNCRFLAGFISFLCLAFGAVCENANLFVGIIWIL